MVLLLSPQGFSIIPRPFQPSVYRTAVFWAADKTTIQLANPSENDVEIIKLTLQVGSKSTDVTGYLSGTILKAKTGLTSLELQWPNSFYAWEPGTQYVFKFEFKGGGELAFTETAPASDQNPPNPQGPALNLMLIDWTENNVTLSTSNTGDESSTGLRIFINSTDYTAHSTLPASVASGETVQFTVDFEVEYDISYNFTLAYNEKSASITVPSPAHPVPYVSIFARSGGFDIAVSHGFSTITVTQVFVDGVSYSANLPLTVKPTESGNITVNCDYFLGWTYNFTVAYTYRGGEGNVTSTYTTASPLGVSGFDKYDWGDGTTSLYLTITVSEMVTVKTVMLAYGETVPSIFVGSVTENCSILEFYPGPPYFDFYLGFPNRVASSVFDHATWWVLFELTDGRKILVEVGE